MIPIERTTYVPIMGGGHITVNAETEYPRLETEKSQVQPIESNEKKTDAMRGVYATNVAREIIQ